jgi:glyoxylase-like metal-dependent hydrolase (beta-lactamase superfamily II)/8-oxo-dGTP pyrophosphatase MutT (NUDIX family)
MPDPTPPRPHRPSAAVILIRSTGENIQVFWVQRSADVSYMPEFRAFIGGTVDPGDAEIPIEGAFGPDAIERACAFREAFEEAGVLIGVDNPGTPAALAEARKQLLNSEATFSELAKQHGWRFGRDALSPAGRWSTPAFSPRRFETQFYVARVPEGQEPSVHPGELASGEWIRPTFALRRWQLGYEAFAAPILYTLIGLAHGEEGIAQLPEAPEAANEGPRRIEIMWGFVLHAMKTKPLPPALHTNAYLVGEPEMALIDPGSGDPEELNHLFAVIDALEKDRRKLKLVLLTHAHPDHIGGVEAIRQRYGVRVGAHAETAKLVSVDFTIKDGEWIPLVPGVGDWSLQAIHTPGHARGHLCFFHPRTGALISGDHVTGSGTVIVDPPEGNMADYIASLERLQTMNIRVLFPAHGSPQGAAKKRIQGLIDHRWIREKKVEAALSGQPQSLEEMVEKAYDDTPRELWPFAERSLLAHLEKLEKEGKALRERDLWRGVP